MGRRAACIGILFFGLVLTNMIHAQTPLDLEEAINIAIANNPSIKAFEEETYGKEMDRRSSIANMLPKIKLTYGYARLKEAPSFDLPAQSEAWLPTISTTLENPKVPYYNSPSDTNLYKDPAKPEKVILGYVPPTPAQEFEVGTKDNYDFTIEATQPLFTGGALWHGYKIAKSDVEVANIDKQRAIRELKLNLKFRTPELG